jgi:hypothetical protein
VAIAESAAAVEKRNAVAIWLPANASNGEMHFLRE